MIREHDSTPYGIDEALGCVKVQMYKTSGETGTWSAEKEFGLIPTFAIRVSIPVVQPNVADKLLDAFDSGQNQVSEFGKGESRW